MDIQYLLLLQSWREACNGIFDPFMLLATQLGEANMAFLLFAAVYWCLDKRAGQLMAWNLALGCAWNKIIKKIVKIDRPWLRDERIQPVEAALEGAPGYSFPSGHSSRATASWGTLGYSLWKKKALRILSVFCWAVVALVMFSRNYLGVHTPQDVLVALAIGIALMFASDALLSWVDRGKNRDAAAVLVCLASCLLPMFWLGWISSAGCAAGLLLGWLAERHAIRFDTAAGFLNKLICFIPGAVGILFCQKLLPDLLALALGSTYADFLSEFILGFFVMAIYPWCFCKVCRRSR